MMFEMKKFQDNFDQAIKTIEQYQTTQSTMQSLVEWMLTTDANPYSYLPEAYAGSVDSAEMFAGLLNTIHHALYDDGDITFVAVNGEPRIVFVDRYDVEKQFPKGKVVEVLDIEPGEFVTLYNEYQTKEIKRCFITDAKRFGLDFGVEHYKHYKCFDTNWIKVGV